MADFTDKEDQALIRFAAREEARGNSRIPWGKIAKLMRSKKRPEQLRLRVVCLRKRFGTDLTKFPPRYLCTSKSEQHKNIASSGETKSVLEVKGPKQGREQKKHVNEQLNEGDMSETKERPRSDSLISMLALLDDDMDDCHKEETIPRLVHPSTLQLLLPPQVDSDSPPQLIQRKRALNRRHKTSYKKTTLHLSSIVEKLDVM